ncbi:unnamed protein product [Mytilus coruscus]|uniref:Tyr recombinase domain-containing protein n=1 Tax=Mytilus coruscus TaxID=42192 RepID=A0A6J8BGU8_MYTCO|nr:unnamed protein product [Mytilus coruscus]
MRKNPTKPRLPITFTILKDIFQFFRKVYYTPYVDILLEAACVMAYFGFLRCAEFTVLHSFHSECNVCIADMRFLKDKVIFHLKASKTDHFVKMLIFIYLRREFLFVQSYLWNVTWHFVKENSRKALTGNYFISSPKKILVVLGYNSNLYNGHSFCIGQVPQQVQKLKITLFRHSDVGVHSVILDISEHLCQRKEGRKIRYSKLNDTASSTSISRVKI